MNQTTSQADLDFAAFERTAPLRDALPLDQAAQYNLDAMFAVGNILQTATRLAPHRAAIASLTGFSVAHLDGYEDLGRALKYAHHEVSRRVEILKQTPALAEEGYRLRQMMMAYLEILSIKGTVSPALVARLKEGSGYRDLAEDLGTIVHEFRALPANVLGASPLSAEEVDRAGQVSYEILTRMGVAESDPNQETLRAARQKLAALAIKSQSQLRRAMAYLRFDQGDAAELVPSLFVAAGRPSKGAKDGVERLASALHDELHAHGDVVQAAAVDPQDNPFEA